MRSYWMVSDFCRWTFSLSQQNMEERGFKLTKPSVKYTKKCCQALVFHQAMLLSQFYGKKRTLSRKEIRTTDIYFFNTHHGHK